MALSKLLAPVNLPDLHPPSTFVFPKREFGKAQIVKRSCQSSWFSKWKWLHYCEKEDKLFCHLCVNAIKSRKTTLKRGDTAFICKGFCNWKDATLGIKNHESSACHKSAMEVMVVLPSFCKDIGEQLSQLHADEKRDNHQCLLKNLV